MYGAGAVAVLIENEITASVLVLVFCLMLSSLSQCRTVVPHCCKGDAASQWEMAILGMSELRNP